MRTVGNVRQFMSCEVVLSLKGSVANVANKSAFNCVLDNVLFDQVALGKCHLTFRTAVEDRAVESSFLSDFTGLKSSFK